MSTLPAQPSPISVVVPVYNAESTIARLVEGLTCAFDATDGLEIVLVNDGSADGTHAACVELVARFPGVVRYYRLARNFGEHNAVMAGLGQSTGAYVVIMDDDFQDRPEDAVRLARAARDGDYDVVYGQAASRSHGAFRVLGSRFNGWIAGLLIDKPKDLYLSSFKCLSRGLIEEVTRYDGPFPYLDGLILRSTDKIGTAEVANDERLDSESGYTVGKLVRLWMSMSTNFSVLPLRISTGLGFLLVTLSLLLSAYVVGETFFGSGLPAGWPFLAISIMLLSGAQLLILGIIGEYIGRLFMSVNRTPQYVIRDSFEPPADDGSA